MQNKHKGPNNKKSDCRRKVLHSVFGRPCLTSEPSLAIFGFFYLLISPLAQIHSYYQFLIWLLMAVFVVGPTRRRRLKEAEFLMKMMTMKRRRRGKKTVS